MLGQQNITDRERHLLALRMMEIDAELQDIANLRVVGEDDPASAEEALLEQQEEIEYRLGLDYFERRDLN